MSWLVPNHGALSLTQDRRLLFWRSIDVGAIQLSDEIPSGALWWEAPRLSDPNCVDFVVGHSDPTGLFLNRVDLEARTTTCHKMDAGRGVKEICCHNNVLFAVHYRCVNILSLTTGELILEQKLPTTVVPMNGRFFYDQTAKSWLALSYDGQCAHLETIHDDEVVGHELLAILERPGIDGPIGVTDRGDLLMMATGEIREIDFPFVHPVEVKSLARDGAQFLIGNGAKGRHENSQRKYVVDVDSAKVVGRSELPNVDLSRIVANKNPRYRFNGIMGGSDGALYLLSRRQLHYRLTHHPGRGELTLVSSNQVKRKWQAFEPVDLGQTVGFRLYRAQWNDGSEAFLDSRGLLHLKSADYAVPEISIALTGSALACWCSDGRLAGEPYFTGRNVGNDLKEIYISTIQGFVERLP